MAAIALGTFTMALAQFTSPAYQPGNLSLMCDTAGEDMTSSVQAIAML